MKNAAGVVTFTVFSMLALGAGKQIIVDGHAPEMRFYISVCIAGVTLAFIATVEPEAGAAVSYVVLLAMVLDDLAPVLLKIHGDNPGKNKQSIDTTTDTSILGADTEPVSERITIKRRSHPVTKVTIKPTTK